MHQISTPAGLNLDEDSTHHECFEIRYSRFDFRYSTCGYIYICMYPKVSHFMTKCYFVNPSHTENDKNYFLKFWTSSLLFVIHNSLLTRIVAACNKSKTCVKRSLKKRQNKDLHFTLGAYFELHFRQFYHGSILYGP